MRANGELSLLDLDDGRERELTDSVELFWVTCGHSEEKTNLIEEVSWLDYGHRGMQVKDFSSILISYYMVQIRYTFSNIWAWLIFILVGSFLQVWYPSPGLDAFKQEDFLQVYLHVAIKLLMVP